VGKVRYGIMLREDGHVMDDGTTARLGEHRFVMTTTTDGVSWTPVVRIPTDPLNSGVDHFIPGLAVDPNTGGSSAHLALTYYYFPAASSDLYVGFSSSLDGGGASIGAAEGLTFSFSSFPATHTRASGGPDGSSRTLTLHRRLSAP